MAGAVICPSCGRENHAGQRECAVCEARLATTEAARPTVTLTNRECPACKFPVDSGQLACPVCGTALEPGGEPAVNDAPSVDTLEQVVLPPPLRERYTLIEELESSGGEAQLFLVMERSGEGPRLLLKRYALGRERLDDATLAALKQSAHEHVVDVADYGMWNGHRWELLEYCEGGSLRDVLDARDGRPVDENEAMTIVQELASALAHLHERGFVHRDLKPGNILVREPWPNLDLVLADFGLVAVLDGATSIARSGNMTLAYAAPEAIAQRFGPPSDWWSLGVIVMEILLGRHPAAVAAGVDPAMRMIVATQDYDVTVVESERWQHLCAGLLTRDPAKRWSGAEVQSWLNGQRPKIHRSLAGQDGPRRDAAGASFKLYDRRAGKQRTFTDPEELAAAMRTDWEAALALLDDARERVRLAQYLHSHFPDSDRYVAPLLERASELGGEQRLIMLLVLLAPDAPPFFRGEPLLQPDGSLHPRLRSTTSTALDVIGAIYDQDVLGSYAAAEEPERLFSHRPLAEISRDWRELMRDAEAALTRLPAEERSSVRRALLARSLQVVFGADDAERRSARTARLRQPSPDWPTWWTELVAHQRSTASRGSELVLEAAAARAEDEREQAAEQRRLAARRRARAAIGRSFKLILGWTVALGLVAVGAGAGLTFGHDHAEAAPALLAALHYVWPAWIAAGVLAWLAVLAYDFLSTSRGGRPWVERMGFPHLLAVIGTAAICAYGASTGAYVPPTAWTFIVLAACLGHVMALALRLSWRRGPAVRMAAIPVCLLGLFVAAKVPPKDLAPTPADQQAVDASLIGTSPLAGCHPLDVDAMSSLLTRDSVLGAIHCHAGGQIGTFLAFRNSEELAVYSSQRIQIVTKMEGQTAQDCADGSGTFIGTWHPGSDTTNSLGDLYCWTQNQQAHLDWSDGGNAVFSAVTGADRGQLYEWWRHHSAPSF